MNDVAGAALELDDIQSGVLRPRPSPFAATYVIVRIDEAAAGRELLRRLASVVTPASATQSAIGDAWASVALTCEGFKAIGLPETSLKSFAWEFQQGMAARAQALGDTGESAPEHWEPPFGRDGVHLVLTGVAPDADQLEAAVARGRAAIADIDGVTPIWRQECHASPDETEPFGYRDGISHPAIEGSGAPASNPLEPPLKAGELVLGYLDELGGFAPVPTPDVLGRNGSYVVFRKLHQRVAAFRQYLRANASGPEDEELLAAKIMGRWRSGAPLALSPEHDDPALGADPGRRNAFLYREDDATGYKTPPGSHARRANPRDSAVAGYPRLHRMVRRGTAYGPPLPHGVLEDDGVDRGLMFAFVGAHPKRQFEFVQSEWIGGGEFLGLGDAKDPVVGEGGGDFQVPRKPIPRRLHGLPHFVVTRGGEYAFMPSLSALRWLAALES
ncbi:MAG TPA: Dyp-type peroxidase [Caulobacteraceae bacterium]|nr:Dyp-type peroxidase [Caulobacteraceae bacterium]